MAASSLKRVVKDLAPPLLLRLLRRRGGLGFHGDYGSWEEARAACTGYDAPGILERVSSATEAVVSGRAAFERDSVLFPEPDYPWPLLTLLQFIARRHGGSLRLVDFGGSLGSTYRQCAPFLEGLEIRWTVVEQPAFVARGRERFLDGTLDFQPDLKACFATSRPTCLLLSSVLQYLEDPFAFLRSAADMGFEEIVIDRTPFSVHGRDRIVKQVVPPEIYPATYPARTFARNSLLGCLEPAYERMAEFKALDGFDDKTDFRGFLFLRRDRAGSRP